MSAELALKVLAPMAAASLALLAIGRLSDRSTFIVLRTVGLLGLLFSVLAGVTALLTKSVVVGAVIGLAWAAVSYLLGPKMVLVSMGAVREEEFRALRPELSDRLDRVRQIVSELASKAGIREPKLVVVPEETGLGALPNAFAVGRRSSPVVGVTEGLLKLLNDREIRGVLGHEVSHIRNRDTLIMTLAAAIGTTLSYALDPFINIATDSEEDWLTLIGLGIVVSLIVTLITAAISRTREYLADEGSARLTGDPLGLANALAKIEEAVRGVSIPAETAADASTAHLWIRNPFSGRLARLFSTHPPTEKRIERLRKLAEELS